MAWENQSISNGARRGRSVTSDQTLQIMHAVRISCPASHTESHKEAVQDALLTGKG
jgi:hypothetical protein